MKLEFLDQSGKAIVEIDRRNDDPIPYVGDEISIPLTINYESAEQDSTPKIRDLKITRRKLIYGADPLQMRALVKVQFWCE